MIGIDETIALIINSGELEDQRGDISRPIDWGYSCESPDFVTTLAAIRGDLTVAKAPKRKRTIGKEVKLRNTLEGLILDLYMAWKSDKKMQLGISLSSDDYNSKSSYHKSVNFYFGLPLSLRYVKAACNGLEQLGYAVVTKGYIDRETGKGKRTRIIATEKLIALLDTKAQLTPYVVQRRVKAATIILKDKNKTKVTYRPNKFTRQASENLKRINQCLSTAWIDLYVTDDEFEKLKERQIRKSQSDDTIAPTVDFNAHQLRRIFNNKDWKQGGRFYGGWWQSIPSDYRKFIHINDKKTVELDFSGIHPAMLYAEVGYQAPDDPYDMGLGKIEREIKKTAFNAMINKSGGELRRLPEYDEERTGLSWREFINKVKESHHPIRKFFNSGHGLKLQYKDSEIAERVMLHFAERGYPCLPVHDSFIIHHRLKDELLEEMEKAFKEVVKSSAKIDTKKPFTYKPPPGSPDVDMEQSIKEMFGEEGAYKGYYHRRVDWNSQRT